MKQTTLRIYLFIESAFRNEDFHHAVEHRIFEHESIRELENEEHTSISAFAHVTGIFFKIVSAKWGEEEILRAFSSVLEGEIPNFSPEEQKRFQSELREREFDKRDDLVESSPFKSELESSVPNPVVRFSDFITRKSVVIVINGETEYRETRYAKPNDLPVLTGIGANGTGKEFHLVAFHKYARPEDSLYAAMYSEFVRARLRDRFSKNGKVYDIWASLYNEAGYAHSGFYWNFGRKRKFTFKNEDLDINEQAFERFKKVVSFDTKTGHEDGYFALNAIVGIDPKRETEALEDLTYKGFLKFLMESGAVLRLYCR